MAIVDKTLVTPMTIAGPLDSTLLDGTGWLAQPPHIGITSGFAQGDPSTVNVLWDNCIFDLEVPVDSLLEITAPAAATLTAFNGKIVRRTVNNQSNEYIGAPVLLAGIVLPFAQLASDFAVIKSVGPGQFFWVSLVGQLEVVAGR